MIMFIMMFMMMLWMMILMCIPLMVDEDVVGNCDYVDIADENVAGENVTDNEILALHFL